jgi:TPR repeat protein
MGDRTPVEKAEAATWWRRSAEQGDHHSAFNLARALSQPAYGGMEFPLDKREAFKWFTMAAAAGDDEAIYAVAHAYATGDGVDLDTVEAAKHFEAAAEAGHVKAAAFIGCLYVSESSHLTRLFPAHLPTPHTILPLACV